MVERRYLGVTPEARAEAVKRVAESEKSLSAVARELGVDHRTLWQWVNNARLREVDPGGELTREQRSRIRDLEAENARLRRDLDFQKKAGAFFRELDRDANDSL
ncbi:transposase [Salinibacterium sp.]|uniref:transposase n=1 Tax=Salinibacterium sp. TaxID=1915057 RepID=UPI00286CA96E|nr:transposase [Salinibacterium sp.]